MTDKIYLKLKKYLDFILKKDFLLAVLIGLAVILFTTVIGIYNNKVIPVNGGAIARYNLEPNDPLKTLANWDSLNYIHIASYGYDNTALANFFPLYPILVRLVNHVIPSLLISSLIVAWACFILAIYFYLKLVKLLFRLKTNLSAIYALAFFILFPTGVFLVAAYNTSLLAFLSIAAIYFALKKRPLLAGIFGFFDTLTHLTAVFVMVLAALILLENKIKIYKIIYSFIIGMLGIASYSLYLKIHFNNALAFISAQKSHGWLSYHFGILDNVQLVYIPILILVLLSIIYWWNKRKSFSIYSFFFLLIPIIGGQFGGFNRYCLLDFPIALMLYSFLKNKRSLYTLAIVLVTVAWVYYAFQYIGGYTGG